MDKLKELLKKNTVLFLVASLTLGLAPFSPEPHLFGKVRWVAGGGVGMKGMDWFDLFLHGTPFILLIISLLLRFIPSKTKA